MGSLPEPSFTLRRWSFQTTAAQNKKYRDIFVAVEISSPSPDGLFSPRYFPV